MTLPSESLPCDQFTHIPEDLEEIYNQETFQEVENLHTDTPSEARSLLLSQTELDFEESNPFPESHVISISRDTWFLLKFKELGWLRARNRLRLVVKTCSLFAHGRHKLFNASWRQCYLCRSNPSYLLTESDRIINWVASKQTEEIISPKKLAEKYHNIQ
jgi:hypothetical protein